MVSKRLKLDLTSFCAIKLPLCTCDITSYGVFQSDSTVSTHMEKALTSKFLSEWVSCTGERGIPSVCERKRERESERCKSHTEGKIHD